MCFRKFSSSRHAAGNAEDGPSRGAPVIIVLGSENKLLVKRSMLPSTLAGHKIQDEMEDNSLAQAPRGEKMTIKRTYRS